MTERKGKKRPWRENIEALTMAIAVALLFKVFLLEISRIPSGSMQPTLMGSPETGIFDRIVVDKLSFAYRDPERFEIVVFKHPLERSRIMVKRLVGLPGEDFKIENGDLWTRPDGERPWSVLRKPPAVQEEMWRTLEPRSVARSSWSALDGGEDWRFQGRTIKASGPGRAGFRAGDGAIRNRYADGYPDSLRDEIGRGDPGDRAVGDLRLEGELVLEAGTRRVVLELGEGDRTYHFLVPGPAAPAGERPGVEVRRRGEAEPVQRTEAGEARPVAPGAATAFLVENLDDRLRFVLDGEELLTLEVDPVPRPQGSVSVAVEGSGADLLDLMVSRDLYYTWPDRPGEPWVQEIPEGSYLMLGDNTRDSADSRDWESTSFTWELEAEGEMAERGNYRPGLAQPNPIAVRFPDGEPGWAFRDRWGERHWLREDRIRKRNLQPHGTPEPFVPRELILGRAVAVFWPISVSRRMWRLGWLH